MSNKILIVESRFYPEIADAMLQSALSAAKGAEVLTVPGALEIPPAIAMAAASGRYDGFVALGCVVRGETHHFEVVANESAGGLMNLAVEKRLAIGNGILTVENMKQARARITKGMDAAEACLALIEARKRFS